jgi:hypothetical protein
MADDPTPLGDDSCMVKVGQIGKNWSSAARMAR